MLRFFKEAAPKAICFTALYAAVTYLTFQERMRQTAVLEAKNPGCKIVWDPACITGCGPRWIPRIEHPDGTSTRPSF